jgi:hypothetical protein
LRACFQFSPSRFVTVRPRNPSREQSANWVLPGWRWGWRKTRAAQGGASSLIKIKYENFSSS